MLSQSLLFRNQANLPSNIYLHIAAKQYSSLLLTESLTGKKVKSWLVPPSYEQFYRSYLEQTSGITATDHICNQINILKVSSELKYNQLLFYNEVESIRQNTSILVRLIKLMIQLFRRVVSDPNNKESYKNLLHKSLKVFRDLPKEVTSAFEPVSALQKSIPEDQPQFQYIYLHTKLVLADFELPKDSFEECSALLKDLEDRNFKRVFSRVLSDPIDDQTIELLSKYYSAEFLHLSLIHI